MNVEKLKVCLSKFDPYGESLDLENLHSLHSFFFFLNNIIGCQWPFSWMSVAFFLVHTLIK